MKQIYVVSTAKLCCFCETAAHPSPWQPCCNDLQIYLRLKVQLQSRISYHSLFAMEREHGRWYKNSKYAWNYDLYSRRLGVISVFFFHAQVFTMRKPPPQFSFTFSTKSPDCRLLFLASIPCWLAFPATQFCFPVNGH